MIIGPKEELPYLASTEGPYEMEVLRLLGDDPHFFRVYSNPLDIIAVNMFTEKKLYFQKSLHCIEVKEKLYALYLVSRENLVPCVLPCILSFYLEVLLYQMKTLSIPKKLSKAWEREY